MDKSMSNAVSMLESIVRNLQSDNTKLSAENECLQKHVKALQVDMNNAFETFHRRDNGNLSIIYAHQSNIINLQAENKDKTDVLEKLRDEVKFLSSSVETLTNALHSKIELAKIYDKRCEQLVYENNALRDFRRQRD